MENTIVAKLLEKRELHQNYIMIHAKNSEKRKILAIILIKPELKEKGLAYLKNIPTEPEFRAKSVARVKTWHDAKFTEILNVNRIFVIPTGYI